MKSFSKFGYLHNVVRLNLTTNVVRKALVLDPEAQEYERKKKREQGNKDTERVTGRS
jgi:hypothetical protein